LLYARQKALFPDQPEVRWKSVDEGWIFHDPAAGTTLLLAPVARFVLDLLPPDDGAASIESLTAAVQREEPDASGQECREAVTAALNALLNANLIRTAPLDRP
jgi:hypothetical protein